MPVVSDNLGELFLEFLKFYGSIFDPSATGINIINGGSFFQLEYHGYESVVTIDPVNQLNNTRMSYQISEVLSAFKTAYEKIHQLVMNGRRKSLLKQIFKQ